MEQLISLLRFFGITESEAKVYISLLQNGPGTGYEISKASGVPRSKVYNILETLVGKGFVVFSHSEKTSLYRAEPANQVISLLRLQTDHTIDLLEKEFPTFDHPVDNERIWQVRGYDSIMNKCRLLIREAKEVLLQIWATDLDAQMEALLLEKQQSGVKVLVILYDETEKYRTTLKGVYYHGFEANKMSDAGSRWITVTTDYQEMCYSVLRNGSPIDGIYTQNKSLVFFAHEYIQHDAYCLRLIQALGPEAKKVFGEKMVGVRDIFSGVKI